MNTVEPMPIAPCPNPECGADCEDTSYSIPSWEAPTQRTYYVHCLDGCGYRGPRCKTEAEAIRLHNLIASPASSSAAAEAAREYGNKQLRQDFEAWYIINAFDLESNPIGSRQCDLQWRSWAASRGYNSAGYPGTETGPWPRPKAPSGVA